MYTVKFLDNESFDNLPYKRVSSAVGLADSNKGIAYVRDTGNPMDIFTAYHELEHLKGDDLGEHEDPDENGVYYKDIGKTLAYVAPFAALLIPGVGPALFGAASSVGGALSGVGGALAGAAGSVGSGLSGLFGGGPAAAGYAANAGNVGAGMGLGIGSGTAGGSAAASSSAIGGAGGGILGSAGKGLLKSVGGSLASDATNSFLNKSQPQGGPSTMNQFTFPTQQAPTDPSVSPVGGDMGQSPVSKIRSDEELAQLAMGQKGSYAGRSVGGF